MIKVSVLYPNADGARFDKKYYLATHIPLVQQKLAPALRGLHVESGLAGGAPGSQPPYVAIANLAFDSVDAFQTAFTPHAQAAILGDIPNYTTIQPVIQISAVEVAT